VYHDSWGQFIFQSGSEMAQNFAIRKRLDEVQGQLAEEKEWWEKRRTSIQSEFMKELDAESNGSVGKATTKSSDDEAVMVEAPSASSSQQLGKKKKGKK
jgi:translocation protein SEC66